MSERKSVHIKLKTKLWHEVGIKSAVEGITKRDYVESLIEKDLQEDKDNKN